MKIAELISVDRRCLNRRQNSKVASEESTIARELRAEGVTAKDRTGYLKIHREKLERPGSLCFPEISRAK
jgi:hypothetical protein